MRRGISGLLKIMLSWLPFQGPLSCTLLPQGFLSLRKQREKGEMLPGDVLGEDPIANGHLLRGRKRLPASENAAGVVMLKLLRVRS